MNFLKWVVESVILI